MHRIVSVREMLRAPGIPQDMSGAGLAKEPTSSGNGMHMHSVIFIRNLIDSRSGLSM